MFRHFNLILPALALCLSIFVSGLFSGYAHAATSSVRIPGGGQVIVNAKTAFRDYDKGVMELRGEPGEPVQIVFNQQYLSCQRAIINEKTMEIEAEGSFVLSSPQAYIEGDSAKLNYRDNTGTIVNGFVKSGQVIFEGKVVRKTGEDTYEADSAYYTACTTCPTAWSFEGSQIRAEIGGYAYIKNSVLEIADVPVLWLPYLIVPLKSERQTGLLIPSLDFSSSGGFALSLRWFWAISRSQDAMFTAKNYSRRGLKGLANYRYVLTDTSMGEMNVGYIRDRVFATEQENRGIDVGKGKNRWFVNYGHRYELPENFTHTTALNLVSDLDYPSDFSDETPGHGDPALENRLALARNLEKSHSSVEIGYYINMIKENPLDSNRDAVHRFPEIRYSLTEQPILGDTLFNFNFNYVNFARQDLAFDDVNQQSATRDLDFPRGGPGAGVFNPGSPNDQFFRSDVIRTGQRMELMPEISYPMHAGPYLDVLPSLLFRHTQYSFNVTAPEGTSFDTAPYRQYVRARVSARTRFSRIFGSRPEPPPPPEPPKSWVDSESKTSAALPDPNKPLVPPTQPDPPPLYRHEVEPEIVLTKVPYLYQTPNSPFFGEGSQLAIFREALPISDADFTGKRGIQFDYNDRLTNRNTLSYSLSNNLVRKLTRQGVADYKQIASVKLMQSYDFDEATRSLTSAEDQRFPFSDISLLIDMRLDRFETNSLFRYYPYHRQTNTASRARYFLTPATYLEAGFTQSYEITELVRETKVKGEETMLGAGLKLRYADIVGGVVFSPQEVRISPEGEKPERFESKYQLKAWRSSLNVRPPGKCWGIRGNFEQQVAQELRWTIDFDFQFGGDAI